MDLLFIIGVSFIGGVIAGVVIEHYFFKGGDNDDSDGKIKQQIYDTLTKVKKDLEETV
jgi:hypothetical protein